MLFNSFGFLVFFPIVTILFFLLPHKFRWFHLLVASCIFYMYFVPIYIIILFGTIIIDYLAGILIERSEGRRRRLFLTMSVVANVGVLAVFKYYNFFTENLNAVLVANHAAFTAPYLRMILPIGLSFHTFQAMSYTIEVFRGNQKAERHLGIYSLYVMFYPQLVAGPIERPQNILHQFHEKKTFNYDNVANGLRQMAWGLMKKSLVADRLAGVIDPIFKDPHHYSSTGLCVALFLYAFQIYCDFSGYSDIALGAAKVMGYDLMVNFNHPFRSKSVTEFWRRWHISLSTWFNDYLFNPMITSWRNGGIYAVVAALMLTFLLSGFWHGAGWKFVIFGLFHGVYVSYEFVTRKRRKKIFGKLPPGVNKRLSVVLTFLFVVYAWIFFRANTVNDAFYIAKKAPALFPELLRAVRNHKLIARELLVNMDIIGLLWSLGIIILLEWVHKIEKDGNIYLIVGRQSKALRWTIYTVSFLLIVLFGVFNSRQFIYFQFYLYEEAGNQHSNISGGGAYPVICAVGDGEQGAEAARSQ